MTAVGAILLAAGRSSRMGTCKQLLRLGDRPVLDHSLETLLASGISDIVVVVSTADGDVARAAGRFPVRIAVNSCLGGDMATSVRTGRDNLPPCSGVLVVPGDYPLVLPATVKRLIESHAEQPERIIIPVHSGQRGHPLLFPRQVLAELVAGRILRDLVRNDPRRVVSCEVADPGILQDMDTPEDFRLVSRLFDHRPQAPGPGCQPPRSVPFPPLSSESTLQMPPPREAMKRKTKQ